MGLSLRAALVVAFVGSLASAAHAATYRVTDFDDDDGTCPSDGKCTLRTAIQLANANVGSTITFASGNGGNIPSITLAKPLDAIVVTTTIDAIAGVATGTAPRVVLDCKDLGSGSDAVGLTVAAGSGTVIRGLIIQNCAAAGVELAFPATATEITQCYLGTDKNGLSPAGNGDGVLIAGSSGNLIGGSALAAHDLISGNSGAGVHITGAGATGNAITFDLIGTNVLGATAIANGDGVRIEDGAATTVVSQSLISGNTGDGVVLSAAGAGNTLVQNQIGLALAFTPASAAPLGNGGAGVRLDDTSAATIGASGMGNFIANNGGAGVAVTGTSTGDAIRFNAIYADGGLAIDLGDDGVSLNDDGDGDDGPNGLQNFPVIDNDGAWNDGAQVVVSGTLVSAPLSTYDVELYSSPSCSAAGHGPLHTFIGAATISSDAAGGAVFHVRATATNGEDTITAIATDSSGDTSEVSTCVAAQSCPDVEVDPATLPDIAAESATSITLSADGGVGPYTFAVLSGSLPSGLSLDASGELSGTTTDTTARAAKIGAVDVHGCSGARNYSFNVVCPAIDLEPVTLAAAAVGAPYDQTLVAAGGGAPYVFTVTAGALPVGLSLSRAGRLTGAATVSGDASFTVTATDAAGCTTSRAYTLSVGSCAAIALSPSTLPGGAVGLAYSALVSASGGSGTIHFAVTDGGLPDGLVLADGGALSGTPTAAGSFAFQITATDDNGCSGTHSYTIDIAATCATIVVAPDTLPAGTLGGAYSATLSASGGASPYSFTISDGALPPGLQLAVGGALTGNPGHTGTYSFVVVATDADGCSGHRSLSIVVTAVCPMITVTPASLPGGAVGATYAHSFAASGGNGPYGFTVSAGALPTGLTLAANGALAGSPSTAGTFDFTITASDSSNCTGTHSYEVTVCPSITLAPSTLPDATAGVAYAQQLTANGAASPVQFTVTAGSLPGSVSLSASGLLAGTPTAAGSASFTVTATESDRCSGSRSYALNVTTPTCPTITLTPTQLADGKQGTAYQHKVNASGGTGPYSFAVSDGTLPAGLSLSTTGTISGTPTQAGTFSVTIVATDAHGCTGAHVFALTIAATCATITLAPDTLPSLTTGVAIQQQLSASGGAAPYGFAVTDGVLPPGVTLSAGGALAGTPSSAGSFAFTVTATDANGCTGTHVYNVQVATAGCDNIAITPVSLPDGTAGVAYAQTLGASGGSPPYAWSSAGALPPGLTLSAAGVVGGTPLSAGTASFAAVVTDSAQCVSARQYSLVVACPSGGCPAIDAGVPVADARAAGDAGARDAALGGDGGVMLGGSKSTGCGCRVGGSSRGGMGGVLLALLLGATLLISRYRREM